MPAFGMLPPEELRALAAYLDESAMSDEQHVYEQAAADVEPLAEAPPHRVAARAGGAAAESVAAAARVALLVRGQ